MRIRHTFVILAALAGCGEEAATDDADFAAVCVYTPFEMSIRAGTHANTDVAGRLVLIEDEPGQLVGGFVRDGDGAWFDVTGSVTDERLSLVVDGFEGGTLRGSGPLSAPFAECPEPMGGDLTGPAADDAGDWQVRYMPESSANEIADAVCDSCRTNAGCDMRYGVPCDSCPVCPVGDSGPHRTRRFTQ
jgi:hypothetical protein